MIDYRVGDARELTADVADGSVALVASSPPFLGLRDYLGADHESKGDEIGAEADPAGFIDSLLAVTAEWGRVLAPWGSIAIELGDSYSGSGAGWPRAKSLALIPQLYACSLAYGRNILTGEPSPAGQWLVRNVIVWHRPNPAVGALGDKFRPSTSYIVVATRSAKRWFDLTAVRTVGTEPGAIKTKTKNYSAANPSTGWTSDNDLIHQNPAGAPPLDTWFEYHDTWTITTQPSSLAHYAMWPPRLADRLILSMCPLEVCATCGEARRRVETDNPEYLGRAGGSTHNNAQQGSSLKGFAHKAYSPSAFISAGWTDCGHDDYRPGVVLDPFAGTGTTCCVAELRGRDSIGLDIDARNAVLVEARMVECKRALFGTKPEMPGQMELL